MPEWRFRQICRHGDREYANPLVNTAQTSAAFDRFDVQQTCRAYFLGHLAALLRDSKLASEAAISAIVDGAGRYFDDMVTSRRRGSFAEEARDLTSSRISLVGDDDLELGIRLDNLSTRLTETTSIPLWKTHLRFVTLLGRPDLPKTDNPVGPQGITHGLLALFQAAGATSLEEKLDLLDRIEVVLRDGLPILYTQIDALLDQAGAEAAQPGIISAQESPVTAKPASGTAEQPPSAASENLLARLSGQQGGGGFSGHNSPLISQASLDNLLFRLDQMERSQRNSGNFLTATSPNLESLIPGLFSDTPDPAETPAQPIRARDLGIPSNVAEGQAIDSVGLICEAIFSDPQLPDVLKTLISSLQVSIVKLAVKDSSLFTRTEHPCRLVINRMGQAVIGLPIDVSIQHPTCTRLFDIASRLRTGFAGDVGAFATAADALTEVLQARQDEIVGQAASYLPLLHQLDRRDQASRDILQLFDSLGIEETPEGLQRFIRQDWKRLLEKTWLEQGPESQSWQEHANILSTLLWTFQPKADSEQRKALARQLPGVLKAIKSGMEALQMSPDAQTEVLDICFALQTRALRAAPAENEPAGSIPTIPAAGIGNSSKQLVQGRIEAGTLILNTMDFASPPSGTARGAHVVGEWMELPLDDLHHPLCLCHQSSASGRYLFFNPEQTLAISVHPALLDSQLKSGNARKLGQPPLFDAAVARALESIER